MYAAGPLAALLSGAPPPGKADERAHSAGVLRSLAGGAPVECHCISPCVLVIKPDGSYRVAFGMRELNELLQYIGIVGPTRNELIAMFTGWSGFVSSVTRDVLLFGPLYFGA